MIKSIAISNFQAHKDTFIEFDKGVNIIAGDSDKGKSTVVRAISWCLYNRPRGEEFRTWGIAPKAETRVTIEFSDGNVVSRVRSNKKNQYELNGQIYKAMRADVPDDIVTATNMHPVNFQPQYQQYFLLDQAPGKIAKELNAVANLQKMDDTLNLVNENVRAIGKTIKIVESNIEEEEFKISELDYVAAMNEKLMVLEQEEVEIDKEQAELEELWETATYIQNIEKEIATLPSDRMIEALFDLNHICKQIMTEDAELNTLTMACTVSRDTESELENYKDVDAAIGELIILNKEATDITEAEKETAAVFNIAAQAHEDQEDIKKTDTISDASTDLSGLDDEGKTIQSEDQSLDELRLVLSSLMIGNSDIKKAEREVTEAEDTLAAYKKELGACPLCDTVFKDLGEPICSGCKQKIDPDVCWCGDSYKNHGYDGHSFVPMGCNCARAKEGE